MGDACEPWGYVAPVVAAVVTRATGVRHIYLILFCFKECGVDNVSLLPIFDPMQSPRNCVIVATKKHCST